MEAHQVQGWLVKGTSKTPSQVLMASAWGQGMPQELRRLEALLRRAARALHLEEQAHTWCRTRSQLVGHGLKASLPWSTVGVLTEEEANWMATHFSNGAETYQRMLDSLEPQNVTLDIMRSIPRLNAQVSNQLRDAAIMAENTVRGRFVEMNAGLNRRQLQQEQRKPIRDRLAQLSLEAKLKAFHPLFLRGRHFRVAEDLLRGIENQVPGAIAEYHLNVEVFCRAEQDPQLRSLATAWFAQAILV